MSSIPYTERRNPLTMNIDTDTPEGRWELLNYLLNKMIYIGIVDSLHQCNLEVFNGYENYKVIEYWGWYYVKVKLI